LEEKGWQVLVHLFALVIIREEGSWVNVRLFEEGYDVSCSQFFEKLLVGVPMDL